MGQKVNPNSFRLNISRSWSSEWYGEKKYPLFIQEDLFIREYLKRKLNKYYTLGSCIIQRSVNQKLQINLIVYSPKKVKHFFRMRSHICKVLTQVTNMNVSLKLIRFYPRYKKFSKKRFLQWQWRRYNHINEFFKIMRFKPNSELIANFLKKEVEKQPKHSQLIQFLKKQVLLPKLFNKCNSSPVLGIKIQFKGRLNGRARARKQSIQVGSIPLSTLNIPIQYSVTHALTKSGVCGIKVWVAFKKLI